MSFLNSVRGPSRFLDHLLARCLIGLVRVYQLTIRPVIGPHCRFEPTCSCYACEAFAVHGGLKGSWLTTRRLLRCRPGADFGYDPVPPPSIDPKRKP